MTLRRFTHFNPCESVALPMRRARAEAMTRPTAIHWGRKKTVVAVTVVVVVVGGGYYNVLRSLLDRKRGLLAGVLIHTDLV